MTELAVIPADKFNVSRLEVAELPESFDAMMKVLHASGVEVDLASNVLADEWPVVDKARLINVPFVLATWTVSKPEDNSEGGGQYLVCRGITKDNKRFRFADGSTGIMAQLVKLTRERIAAGSKSPNAGLYVTAGLTKSDYTFTDDKGKTQPATTYYLSNGE